MCGGSGGASAELISNASFATLMVIYSFTQLMDMADQLSELAGLTTRVAQLMEVRFTHMREQPSAHSHRVVVLTLQKPYRMLWQCQVLEAHATSLKVGEDVVRGGSLITSNTQRLEPQRESQYQPSDTLLWQPHHAVLVVHG